MIHTEFGHSITFISQNWNSNPEFVAPLDKVGEIYIDPDTPFYEQRHIDKNTWESWGLVPESRPTLPHPSQKTKTQECDSINGIIDLSWSNVPYPLFSNREGSFSFIYNPIVQMGYDKYKPWNVLYSEISEFLHGRKLRMVLEDDPEYYYEGRFWVDGWSSETDGSGSKITIGYQYYHLLTTGFGIHSIFTMELYKVAYLKILRYQPMEVQWLIKKNIQIS